MRFTRGLRSREYGALFVPVAIDADRFVFDLLDCVCEIQFDPVLFDTFDQVKILYDGVVQMAYDVRCTAQKNQANRVSRLHDGLVIARIIQRCRLLKNIKELELRGHSLLF